MSAAGPAVPGDAEAPGAPGIAHVDLHLVVGSEPIEGQLGVGGEPTHSFVGWVALAAALDEAIDHLRRQA